MYNSLLEKSISYRGTVLHEIAQMEVMLNLYLSIFFCGKNKEKIADMTLLIWGDDRTNLSGKAQIFKYIAEHYDRKNVLEYVSIRNNDKTKGRIPMNADLVWVIEQRNIFAHRILDEGLAQSLNAKYGQLKEDEIRFVQFKNETKLSVFNNKTFKELIDTIMNISGHLGQMFGELPE